MASNAHFVWNHINKACRRSLFFLFLFLCIYHHLILFIAIYTYIGVIQFHYMYMMPQKYKASVSSSFSICMCVCVNLSFHECLKYFGSLQIKTAKTKFQWSTQVYFWKNPSKLCLIPYTSFSFQYQGRHHLLFFHL